MWRRLSFAAWQPWWPCRGFVLFVLLVAALNKGPAVYGIIGRTFVPCQEFGHPSMSQSVGISRPYLCRARAERDTPTDTEDERAALRA